MESTPNFSRCSSPRAHFNQVVMVMFMPNQSHSGGVIYNIAQELQFLVEKTGEKNNPTKFIYCVHDHHRGPDLDFAIFVMFSMFKLSPVLSQLALHLF